MRKTRNEQKTKPKLKTKPSDWLELFYLQAVLPEQNDTIPLPTIKNSPTLLFALNFAACSVAVLCLATLFTSRH
jgi:hypothetical protein